jgi:tetratricopeptide (TPR) repeat protein
MRGKWSAAAILLLLGTSLAQSNAPQTPASGGSQSAAGSQTQSAPGQTAATAGSQPSTTGQAPSASKQPQAKTKEEYDAYQAAIAAKDPNQLLAAADQFAQKYPNSELRELLYVQAMNLFQQQNNAEKEIEAGRKAIALDPTNPVPLIHVASALVGSTHDNDLDKEQRYAEAARDAQAAIDNINTGLHVPPNVSPQQVQAVKNYILGTAYETLGVIQMRKQDFATAESSFKKAIDSSEGEPKGRAYLRLSIAQDNEQKYQEALDSANKALQYSQAGSLEQTLAKQQQGRLEKLVQAGNSSNLPGPGAVPPTGPTPGSPLPVGPGNTTTPAGSAPPPTTTTPQPH